MDKDLIETFLAIVDLKTVSGAADILYVSQSTVSHRLNSLEEYLGCALFERQLRNKKRTAYSSRRKVHTACAGRCSISMTQ